MNWLSLRNNWLKLKTLERLPIILQESIEYISNYEENPEDVNV